MAIKIEFRTIPSLEALERVEVALVDDLRRVDGAIRGPVRRSDVRGIAIYQLTWSSTTILNDRKRRRRSNSGIIYL